MEKKKISVIIPVYNVEAYLAKCLDSVINQTYYNLEILLINDGSTDGSLAICESYASKDGRIKVFTKPNGGQSSARNFGISQMTGDYVSFVDSDDWLDAKMYEQLVFFLTKYDADLSVCQTYYCREGHRFQPECDNGKEYLIEGYYNMMGHILPYQEPFLKFQAWNKLYKTELVTGVRFKEGQVYEEIDFERNVLKKAKRAVCFNIPLYYYRVGRPGSTVSSFDIKRLVKFSDLDVCIEELNEANEIKYVCKYLRYSMDACLEFSYLAYRFNKGGEIQVVIKDKFDDYKNKLCGYHHNITWRQKIYCISPRLHYYLMALYTRIR